MQTIIQNRLQVITDHCWMNTINTITSVDYYEQQAVPEANMIIEQAPGAIRPVLWIISIMF